MRKNFKNLVLVLTAVLLGMGLHASSNLAAGEGKQAKIREIKLVNLEYEGTKIWLPGLIVCKKGETVKLTLINNAPSGQHGFAIDQFKVQVVVEKGIPGNVEFKANKAGLFPFHCHMHPAHVGGQILVLDK